MLATAPMGLSGHWRQRSRLGEESERITVASVEQPSVKTARERVVLIRTSYSEYLDVCGLLVYSFALKETFL